MIVIKLVQSLFSCFLLLFIVIGSIGIEKATIFPKEPSLIFSAQKGTVSKPDTLIFTLSQSDLEIEKSDLVGDNPEYFNIQSAQVREISGFSKAEIIIVFTPSADFEGIAESVIHIEMSDGHSLPEITLRGLSTKGLEGENEASLASIFRIMGWEVNPGWNTLANHISPELQGDEMEPSLFKKAGSGIVEMIPVARYSPPFHVPFGYYINSPEGPERNVIGILADSRQYPEHQTLYPEITQGSTSFDPGGKEFGFFTISPSHNAYSEDRWNLFLYPKNVAHATRIYPVKELGRSDISYIVCFEEATNGDYQDYVFLLRNAEPVPLKSKFTSLLNNERFDGWYTFLQKQGLNKDPEQIFSFEDGILHILGKELGYLMTERTYTNYHFKLDFMWGEKRWPPRDTLKRDSGICYHIPANEPDQIWPQLIECQIQEGDTGDFWILNYNTIEVNGIRNEPESYARILKSLDAERPYGEWNTVEVLSFNGACIHIVNGIVVNRGENASMRKGKILLQSEYAEIFYRNVQIREF